ncbi:MAG: DNA gyrase subunit A [Myxococcota bacterium]
MMSMSEGEIKVPVTIEEEIKTSYLDYAMSVIIGRALPDVRDGLKPVHRRILYAMFREGLLSNKKYSKCAGVVGEVLKKYHPHGDMAVYDTLVRMAQDWRLRYPLIDGQGNFGSIDGDAAAAYRYTEARLAKIAEEMLADIDKDTVDFIPNYDDTTSEPVVLPSKIPNLLVNGSSGIAVGMATNIPPHNLREVIDALIHIVDNPHTTIDELMEFITGPDFPTGSFILGRDGIVSAYKTGRGIIRMRAKTHFETQKRTGKESIVITEIPFEVNKAKMVERIAELVRDKHIVGISDIRDESDREGLRVVIELKREAIGEIVLNQLYKHTPMQESFGITMLAIVGGRPRTLNLKEMLELFLTHRREVVIRRTKFELKEAENREHIQTGLVIAVDNIDEVINIIRRSQTHEEARSELMERFELSEIQARAILDMRLARLTGLERERLIKELEELRALIADLKEILKSETRLKEIIKSEFKEIRDKYGDERRTVITGEASDIKVEDLIADEDMLVMVSNAGYVKRVPPALYRRQRRGGRGRSGMATREEDFVTDLFVASTHSYILVFTNSGKCYWLKVHEIPMVSASGRGKPIVNLLKIGGEDSIASILPVRNFEEKERYVVFCTKKGKIKKTALADFSRPRATGIIALKIDKEDELINVKLSNGKQEMFIGTKNGLSIRFKEEDVREMGRAAAGVKGIGLRGDDTVVGMEVLSAGATLLTVTENGYGKRTKLDEYPIQKRGGKGVITIKTSERNGKVVGLLQVDDEHDVVLITNSGVLIRSSVKDISVLSRNTQGVRLIAVEEGAKVVSVARLAEKTEGENGEGDGDTAMEEESAQNGEGMEMENGENESDGAETEQTEVGEEETKDSGEDDEEN